jgi:plastocyanin
MNASARVRIGLVVGAALVFAAVGACFSEQGGAPSAPSADCLASVDLEPGSHDVTVIFMRNFSFVPETARVAPGTVVAWVDCEPQGFTESHTTTSDEGLWGSELMNPGDSFSRLFEVADTFPYHCIPHASFMRGVLIVE